MPLRAVGESEWKRPALPIRTRIISTHRPKYKIGMPVQLRP